jgi:hypothetical protein
MPGSRAVSSRVRRFVLPCVVGLRVLGWCIPICLVSVLSGGLAAPARAANDPRVFAIAQGAFTLEAPAGWQRVAPKSGIVETEFAIPGPGEADALGRMTVMGAGGSVQANIDRWFGQFSQPDGGATKERATTKKMQVAGCDVTLVDVGGTYKDMPGGPFAGGAAIERPGYRMLAAIIETPDGGNQFLKFYGPAATVGPHVDGFRQMVEGMVAAGNRAAGDRAEAKAAAGR